MLKQKFQIGDRVTTFAGQNAGDETIWIVDKVELRVILGREPYLVYGIRKLNSYDADLEGVACFYFRDTELVSLDSGEEN